MKYYQSKTTRYLYRQKENNTLEIFNSHDWMLSFLRTVPEIYLEKRFISLTETEAKQQFPEAFK